MELQELKNIWQAYDTKLEKSYRLNMHCLEMIQSQKVRSKLRPLLLLRIAEAALHVIVIYYLSKFSFNHFFEWKFSIASLALVLFFIIALSNCTRQIIIIKQIDYSKDIVDIQKKLNLLQSYIVNYIRLSFLVIPTYLAYPLVFFKALANFDISRVNHNWWIGQIIFTVILIPVCTWLYRQVSYKNVHKKWVRFVIEKSAGNSVAKSMEFIKEIDEYREENI